MHAELRGFLSDGAGACGTINNLAIDETRLTLFDLDAITALKALCAPNEQNQQQRLAKLFCRHQKSPLVLQQ